LSQPCDIRCGLGTARDRDPDADDRALAVPAADRGLALVAGHDDADQRQPDPGAGQAPEELRMSRQARGSVADGTNDLALRPLAGAPAA
jgi:hypothetical protein